MTGVTRGTLIFDGDCGFCTRSVRLLRRADANDRIDLLPLQDPSATTLSGIPAERLAETVTWLGVDGTRATGAEAANAALGSAIGSTLPLAVYRRIPGMRSLQEWVYGWISERRGRLPGDKPWCSQRPGACGRP